MPNSTRRKFLQRAGAASALTITPLAGCVDQGSSGEYPSETITYIVPFGPGGGTDTWGRQIMSAVSDVLDVDHQIENIEGAGSLRGTGELFNSEPDGYTIGAFNPPSTPLTYLLNPQDYDLGEMEGVASYARTSYVLIGNPSYNFEGLDDVVGRYRDGELSQIGGQARGGITHVQAILAREEWDVPWESYIGYTAPEHVEAVATDEIPVAHATENAARSHVENDEVDLIAALPSNGSFLFPDAPVATDQGYANLDYVTQLVRCIWAPPETPDDRITTLTEAIEEALMSDEMQGWAEETGNVIEYHGPEFANDMLTNSLEQIPDRVDLESIREDANS